MEISQAQNCPKDRIFRTPEYAQEMNAGSAATADRAYVPSLAAAAVLSTLPKEEKISENSPVSDPKQTLIFKAKLRKCGVHNKPGKHLTFGYLRYLPN